MAAENGITTAKKWIGLISSLIALLFLIGGFIAMAAVKSDRITTNEKLIKQNSARIQELRDFMIKTETHWEQISKDIEEINEKLDK